MKRVLRNTLGFILHGFLPFLLAMVIPMTAQAQSGRNVSGTVVDEFGEPLIGASVTVPGHQNGVTVNSVSPCLQEQNHFCSPT